MAGVLIMISWAITRPKAPLEVGSALLQRVWEKTASRLPLSCTRIWVCWPAGKTSTIRSTVWPAELVCRVPKTRWPVSAAVIASWIVSRSRSSPTRITSGSSRRAARRAFEKLRVSSFSSLW